MNKSLKRNILVLLAATLLFSCKETEISEPSFEVSASATTVNVGDSVTFKFKGLPDLITFYSGEPGSEYQYNKRSQIENGASSLSFTATNPVLTTQSGAFKVLVSTNFTGVNAVDAVSAATWTDVTSKIKLPTTNSTTPTASGSLDLNQFVAANQKDVPLFVAFRYNVLGAAGQGTWNIKSFDVKNVAPAGEYVIADINTADWVATSFSNTALNWVITPTELTITGRISTPVPAEDWVITKPIYLNRIVPDVGLTIKETSGQLVDFKYGFSKPGTYTVTFLAANANVKGTKQVTRQITINVR